MLRQHLFLADKIHFLTEHDKSKQSTTHIFTNENFYEKLVSAKCSFFDAIDKELRAQEVLNEIVNNMVEENDYFQDRDSFVNYNKSSNTI